MKKIGAEAVFEIAEALAAVESDAAAISICMAALESLEGDANNKALARLAAGMKAKLGTALDQRLNAAEVVRMRIAALRT